MSELYRLSYQRDGRINIIVVFGRILCQPLLRILRQQNVVGQTSDQTNQYATERRLSYMFNKKVCWKFRTYCSLTCWNGNSFGCKTNEIYFRLIYNSSDWKHKIKWKTDFVTTPFAKAKTQTSWVRRYSWSFTYGILHRPRHAVQSPRKCLRPDSGQNIRLV